jgi:hypothetical protein
MMAIAYRFDPVDLEQMRLLGRLSPGQRIQAMLDARELAVGLIRGRLRQQYPDLSPRALNLKVLEEIARVQRTDPAAADDGITLSLDGAPVRDAAAPGVSGGCERQNH